MGDYSTLCYSKEVLEALRASCLEDILPSIVHHGSQDFVVNQNMSNKLGISTKTPIFLAPVDVICCSIGGGIFNKDNVGISILGSTGAHISLVNKSALDIKSYVGHTMLSPKKDIFLEMNASMACTLNFDWFVDMDMHFAQMADANISKTQTLKFLSKKAKDKKPAGCFYHPYLFESGERAPFVDVNAQAMISGFNANTDIYSLFRAILEGVCFAAKDCYDNLISSPNIIHIIGGGSHNELLSTILSSTLNKPIRHIKRDEVGAAGAVMYAISQQQGIDIDEFYDIWNKPFISCIKHEDMELAKIYKKAFDMYKKIYTHNSHIWRFYE